MEDDLAFMGKEFNHKFNLQAAENTRLEQPVITLKKENNNLLEKLVNQIICRFYQLI